MPMHTFETGQHPMYIHLCCAEFGGTFSLEIGFDFKFPCPQWPIADKL